MTTPIDKVKTLIEYARFGEFFARYCNGENPIDEYFSPPAVKTVVWNWNAGYNTCVKKVSGYAETIGGMAFLSSNKTIEEIDLPYCTLFSVGVNGGPTEGEINTKVKIIKLPSLREILNRQFQKLKALEYLEVGATTRFESNALQGCDSLTEFYNKQGTTSGVYLQYCPLVTKECLHKVIENFADMTGTTAPTFYMGAENLAKIDEEHIAMLNKKNIFYQ